MDVIDLLKKAEGCFQEEPAFCNSSCPLRVDARGMAERIRKGDFRSAYRLYRQKALFPRILARTCTEPCAAFCARKDSGGAIRLRLLELASVEFGTGRAEPGFAVPLQTGEAAVVGGGLTGLACALTLGRRGYRVTLYEASDRLGGSLWELDEAVLPASDIQAEVEQVFAEETITVCLNTKIRSLSELSQKAILLATGADGASLLPGGPGAVHPLSLESAKPGVFAAGQLCLGSQADPARRIAQGLQAARSMLRVLKGASVTLNREDELDRPTKLVLPPPAPAPHPPTAPGDAGTYTREQAMEEAERCLLCACLYCTNNCEFLQFYRTYPRKAVNDTVKSLNAIELLCAKMTTRMTNSCNHCGLCKTLCPEHVDMGEICMDNKHILKERGQLPDVFHDFWMRDMEHAMGAEASLHLPGSGEWLYFPGCQMGASDPDYVANSFQYLEQRLRGVGLLLTCCGAPANWSGDEPGQLEAARRIASVWEEEGKPTVILACPTCAKNFAHFLPQIPVVTLWELIERYGLPESRPAGAAGEIAVFDPCAARDFPSIRSAVRSLTEKAGYTVRELSFSGETAKCCGHGGLIYKANPGLAATIYKNRAFASPLDYVTYCTNCRDIFAGEGKRAYHLLDLLFGKAEDKGLKRPPGLSERRENRRRLRAFWRNPDVPRPHWTKLSLLISPELQEKMNADLILLEDLQQVLHAAEESGSYLTDESTGRLIAHHTHGITTYWLEYSRENGAYRIWNLYSHHMTAEE